jgi:Phage tail tube protein
MATAADHFIACAKESTYGVAVTPVRAYPFVDGTESDFDVRWRVGKGITGGFGRRTQLGTREFLPTGQGTLKIVAELESKAAGVLLDAALGVSSVAAITGGSQMLFHTGVPNLVLPSLTWQVAKVRNDGTYLVETYRGCTASKVTIEQPEDDIATIEVEWDALGMTTATAAITPTYAAAPTIFDAYQAQVYYGGALTAPTATVGATVATPSNVWRSWKLEIDQKINDDGWVLSNGVRTQPKAGTPEIKMSGEVEFTDVAIVGNYLAGTRAPFLCTWTTPEVLGAGFAQLQVLIPQIALTKGVPQVKPGEAPTTFDVEAMVSNDGTNRDVTVVYRTADTAL